VDSPEELACMLDMLAENREVLARMGHTAREDAERLYSYETIYREFASRYSALLRS